jgi:tetratricopeptide (TPR) repeat protein
VGTPTTLIALDALQNAKSAKEAVEIIKEAHSLITEIFVVADKESTAYIVEKTPERVRVLEKQTAQAITNHLQHPDFKEDEINKRRMKNNTTLVRQEQIWNEIDSINDEFSMAQALRTKFRIEEQNVLGHRSSVDALIASHSVVYNSNRQRLYVSEGPSLKNRFIGFDLEESFKQKRPVNIDPLPQDPDLMGFNYYQLRGQIKELYEIRDLAQNGDCDEARDLFAKINPTLFAKHYSYYWSRAEVELCREDKARALRYFLKAKKLEPAYLHEREHIDENIANLNH